MSCQIRKIAEISDVTAVRRCLFPMDNLRGTDAWLNNCIISLSPTGELVAIARERKIVILTAKWDSYSSKTNFAITFTDVIDNVDTITALLCLPIVASGQSSQVGPDWTCIIIGFASGIVKFYTENCSLLATEKFHDERVVNIKCQSQQMMKIERSHDNFLEEVYIMYANNVCSLNGTALIQTLRSCRTELAKVQAIGTTLDSNPQFSYKKWGFTDQSIIHDSCVVGLDAANTFDHLLTASTCGGFATRYRAMAPHNTLVVGVGAKPYVAFHYALEGGPQPVLSDVAKAVASKLKSALPGWLTGHKPQSTEKSSNVPVSPAESMGCRFGLCDIRRIADNIILSPEKSLAVVSDSLGRIALIDTKKGICVRLWKGYREADFSFLQVVEESRSKHKSKSSKKDRVALFLIIYARRKGVIEIWALQQGPKIASFTASKNGRLLYSNYGLMGLGTIVSTTKYFSQFNCAFLDPDGQIKDITIPFHFVLSDKNSKKARDLHLVRRLKQFIKSEEYNLEKLCSEILNTCTELKTSEMKLQCIEMLLNIKNIQPLAILKSAQFFLENVQEENDFETKTLLCLCSNINNVTLFYMFMTKTEPQITDFENGNLKLTSDNGNTKALNVSDTNFLIPPKELSYLQRLLDLNTLLNEKKESQVKVSFKEESRSIFYEYLSIFDLMSKSNFISLKESASDKIYRISETLFESSIISGADNLIELQTQAESSKINTMDLLKILLSFWINRTLTIYVNLENEMYMLSKLVYTICKTTILDNICVQYNEVSPFWKSIRDLLTYSSRPFEALTAAILCRGVAQKLEYERELLASQYSNSSLEDENGTEIWEKLSQDNCQWSILIGKLEDVSLLNIILANEPSVEAVVPKLDFEKAEISLKYILQNGKGSVSELIARWLTTGGTDPSLIIANENQHHENTEQSGSASVEKLENFNNNSIFNDHLNMLRKQFPYSLNSSILIANMTWEYSLAWQKNVQNLSYLLALLKCIQSMDDIWLRLGLCNMVWTTHIKHILENTSKLINKVGKLPKERLCRQDTNLSDTKLVIFIKTCTDFFDIFMDAAQKCYENEKKSFKYEDLCENGNIPLTELALQQTEVNYDLLHLHYQLCLTLQMITTLNVKHTKPVNNLFDTFSLGLLFTDFSSSVKVPIYNVDPKLLSSRTQFLYKVISMTIESVRQDEGIIYSSEHVLWMSKCLTLGSVWSVDSDSLRTHQVVQLFNNGFDSFAQELLPAISDKNDLGSKLLAVAGRRLIQIIFQTDDSKNKIVALSPTLSNYLNTLKDKEDWCATSTLESIELLGTHIVRCLSDNHPDSRLANLLLETCGTLAGIQS